MSAIYPASRSSGSVFHLAADTEDDVAVALRGLLEARSIGIESSSDPAVALARVRSMPPDVLLLDTRAVANPEAIGRLLAPLDRDRTRGAALIVLAHSPDIRLRLFALRAGARAFLLAPIDVDALAERIEVLVEARCAAPHRVLVVDDQPVSALFASRVLESAGMVTQRVTNPLEVLVALERFGPDLVLMDLHMPGVSGIELTGIIREQDGLADLPIVFLSAELDPRQQMAALRIGGDDFLAKPVDPERLIGCVRERMLCAAQRQRCAQAPGATDPSTGLASRERLLQRLDQLIGLRRGVSDNAAHEADKRPCAGQRALVCLESIADGTALARLAAGLKGLLQAGDLAARVSERSLALLIRRTHIRDLAGFVRALNDGLLAGVPDVRFGLGWCVQINDCDDAVTLLSRAGKAARTALRLGEGQAVCYVRDPLHDGDVAPVLAAIEEGHMQLLFEPMLALSPLPGARYEAKPRLVLDDGELLAPAEFVAIAREAGCERSIDHWLLSAGLDVMRSRLDAGQPVQLFLHQSFSSMSTEGWIEQIREAIVARDLIKCRPVLQCQIDELGADLDTAAHRCSQLGRLGVRVCLNGLDATACSQRALESIPAAFARLSHDAIKGLSPDELAALIRRAKSAGMKVVAAGVDGPEVIGSLCGRGVDLLQGPFVQPPTAALEFDFLGAVASGPSAEPH